MHDKLQFIAKIDLPLAVATVLGSIVHFNAWARADNANTSADLPARLPAARIRVVCLFAVIVFVCWITNFAVWAIFAFLLGIGAALGMFCGGDPSGAGFLLVFAGYAIREWAFGFPELILHPPGATRKTSQNHESKEDLAGKQGTTVSPLRPCGEAKFDGQTVSVVSETGEFLDTGRDVTVTGKQNGMLCVRVRESGEAPLDSIRRT